MRIKQHEQTFSLSGMYVRIDESSRGGFYIVVVDTWAYRLKISGEYHSQVEALRAFEDAKSAVLLGVADSIFAGDPNALKLF